MSIILSSCFIIFKINQNLNATLFPSIKIIKSELKVDPIEIQYLINSLTLKFL